MRGIALGKGTFRLLKTLFDHYFGRKARQNEGKTNMTVTVFTKPSCVQCTATYRDMDNKGIKYEIVDPTEDETALEAIKELGHLQAPVVVTSKGHHWSGFRPDKIAEIAVELKLAA